MSIPYASFRFQGEVIDMDRYAFLKAVQRGRQCRCGECLNCRAREYYMDVQEEAKRAR
ncbi:MAG: hypothetical protein ACWGQW_03345 [bacterium]